MYFCQSGSWKKGVGEGGIWAEDGGKSCFYKVGILNNRTFDVLAVQYKPDSCSKDFCIHGRFVRIERPISDYCTPGPA